MPLTFPPAPFLFHAAGAEGGMSGAGAILRLSTIPCPQITPLPQRGRGAGGEGYPPHLPPSPLPLPRCGSGRGDERSNSALASVNNAESTTQITPLPQRGRGAGGEGSPSLPRPLASRGGGWNRHLLLCLQTIGERQGCSWDFTFPPLPFDCHPNGKRVICLDHASCVRVGFGVRHTVPLYIVIFLAVTLLAGYAVK